MHPRTTVGLRTKIRAFIIRVVVEQKGLNLRRAVYSAYLVVIARVVFLLERGH